jgi:hypothetical protein
MRFIGIIKFTALRVIAAILLISAIYPVRFDTMGWAMSAALAAFFGAMWLTQRYWTQGVEWLDQRLQIGWIMMLALIVRAVVLLTCDLTQVSDYQDFNNIALSILAGGEWFDPGRPPGVSWLAAAIYALTGQRDIWIPLVVNGLLSVAGIGLVWLLVRQVAHIRAANWAAVLMVLYPEHIIHSNYLCSEVGYFLGIYVAVWLYFAKSAGWMHWLAAGMAVGVAHYFRSTAPLALVALVLSAWAGGHHGAGLLARHFNVQKNTMLRRWVALAIGFGLIVTPIVLHNQAQWRIWSLSSYHMGGWSMYLGTNPTYMGNWNHEDVAQFVALRDALPDSMSVGQKLLHLDGVFRNMAWERWQAHPMAWFRAVLRFKPYCFWGDPSGTWWVDQQFERGSWQHGLAGLWLIGWHKWVLFLAGLAMWQQRDGLPPAARWWLWMAVLHTLVFCVMGTEGRYHNILLGGLCGWAGWWLANRRTL